MCGKSTCVQVYEPLCVLVEAGGPCQRSSSFIFCLISETWSLTKPSPSAPVPNNRVIRGYIQTWLLLVCWVEVRSLQGQHFTHGASPQSLTGVAAFPAPFRGGGSMHVLSLLQAWLHLPWKCAGSSALTGSFTKCSACSLPQLKSLQSLVSSFPAFSQPSTQMILQFHRQMLRPCTNQILHSPSGVEI